VQLHVSACVRVGPASIYIPVKIEDLQLDAVARVTMRPLVDTLPCIGAIQISLTDAPFADLTLKLINSWDILSLPFIHDAVLLGVKVGTEPVRAALYLSNHCNFGRVLTVDNGQAELHSHYYMHALPARILKVYCVWQQSHCFSYLKHLQILL
jgi:hypothetical protein